MRPRRHAPDQKPRSTSRSWRRFARDIGIVAAVFALGYIVSAVWISPAPLFTSRAHAVPRVLGLTQAEANQAIRVLALRGRVTGTRAHPTAPTGTIIWQDPPPDVVLSPNAIVKLAVSAGPTSISVPDVTGLDTATARRILTASGLAVGKFVTVRAGAESGIVITTQPAPGTSRPRDSRVGLVISRGLEGEEHP